MKPKVKTGVVGPYVSVFARPEPVVCNDPDQHEKYPSTHKQHAGCPIHQVDAFWRTIPRKISAHEHWQTNVDNFVNAEGVPLHFLAQALMYVSETCPPDDPNLGRLTKRRRS